MLGLNTYQYFKHVDNVASHNKITRNIIKNVFILLKKETRGPSGQVALNRSPEFCLKLTYRYLLKAGHVPGDTSADPEVGDRGSGPPWKIASYMGFYRE